MNKSVGEKELLEKEDELNGLRLLALGVVVSNAELGQKEAGVKSREYERVDIVSLNEGIGDR